MAHLALIEILDEEKLLTQSVVKYAAYGQRFLIYTRMAQTFFIDADEEIISVIGYLRQSPDIENYFVFPKRSLVLQSAVNLRLFLREAQQSGKHITVISQDEGGLKLAERVGISTKEYATEVGALRQETPPPAAHLAEMSTPAVAPRPFAPPCFQPRSLCRVQLCLRSITSVRTVSIAVLPPTCRSLFCSAS